MAANNFAVAAALPTVIELAAAEGFWFRHNATGEWLPPEEFAERFPALDRHGSLMLHWTVCDPREAADALKAQSARIAMEFYALRQKIIHYGLSYDPE